MPEAKFLPTPMVGDMDYKTIEVNTASDIDVKLIPGEPMPPVLR